MKEFPLLPHFIVQEAEIQKGEVIGLKSHGLLRDEIEILRDLSSHFTKKSVCPTKRPSHLIAH